MSTQTTQPLSLLAVDFGDLYTRHLGRHSQIGINVGHLVALYGLWFGVYAALYEAILLAGLPAGWVIIVALAAIYLALVAINAPYHVCIVTTIFMAVFVASVLALRRCRAGRSRRFWSWFRSSTSFSPGTTKSGRRQRT